jgi:hypothetical protein
MNQENDKTVHSDSNLETSFNMTNETNGGSVQPIENTNESTNENAVKREAESIETEQISDAADTPIPELKETNKAETPDMVEEIVSQVQETEALPEKSETPAEVSEAQLELKAEPATEVANENAADTNDWHDEQDIDDHTHDEELTQHIAYNELSRAELLALLKELAHEEDLAVIKNKVQQIREAYNLVRKEEEAQKKARFLENGGEEDEFDFQRDTTDEEFFAFLKEYNQRRAEQRKQIERELQNNLMAKQEILNELKLLVESNQANKKAFDRLHELQDKWRAIGRVAPAYANNLRDNYKFLLDKFFEVIKLNNELRELDHKRNLELKTKLCEIAEELLLESNLNRALDQYKGLMDQWKEIGYVAKEHSEAIWERFRRVGDQLHERRKELIESRKQHSEQVVKIKNEICEKAEQLLQNIKAQSHTEWQEISNEFNVLMDEWKKAGFAEKVENEKLWERFKQIRNSFFDAKESFYKELRRVQTENYKIKNDLCMEAEALKNSNEWKQTAERLRALQEIWKNTGPVAKKHSDKLWNRFRAACDTFFERRKQHFSGLDEEQQENLNKKLALIEEIKAFEHFEDPQKTIEALKDFQNRYTNIGFVPIKHKEQVYKEYKKAIDKQFEKLRASGQEVRRQLFKAQIENIAQSKDAKPIINAKKQEILDKIRKIQSDVAVLENNIGFLAKSKGADTLKREVEQKIDKSKKDIQTLREQLSIIEQAKS